MAAGNMWRIEINIHEKELYVKLVTYKGQFTYISVNAVFCVCVYMSVNRWEIA